MAIREIRVLIPDEFSELTADQMGALLAQLATLTSLNKAAREYVTAALKRGNTVPGWTLKSARRTKEWISEAAAEAAMRKCGFNDVHKRTLLSPTEALEKVHEEAHINTLNAAWRWRDAPASLAAGAAAAVTNLKF